MLPVALESKFNEFGINIHDPRWGAWVPGRYHRQISWAYQADWQDWLTENPLATLDDIARQAELMAQDYGINWTWSP
jgi:hypothetical protein